MHPGKRHSRRRGLTIVELIVVIAIILLVAALGAAFMPRVQERQNVNRGTDVLSQTLLMAKQRARRDNLVTGIQFIVDPNDTSPYQNQYTQFVYVQQPPVYTNGQCLNVVLNPDGKTYTATFQGVDFQNAAPQSPAEWIVQPGDYFLMSNWNGGNACFITGVTSNQLTLYSGALSATPTFNYRVIRKPRQLLGEPVVQMPGTVTVDLGSSRPAMQTQILFAPNGSVTGSGVGGGKIIYWVKDPTSTDQYLGGLVAIQTQSGFISTYSINPMGDPFSLADQGRDDGF